MKRLFTCIAALAIMLMASLNTNAQINIPLPNSSFEDWSNGSGYSVTVLFFPLQVYSSYTYPTNWSYPSYPVNESITYSGMTVNVNTNLPLLKVSHETSSVADGSSALKMLAEYIQKQQAESLRLKNLSKAPEYIKEYLKFEIARTLYSYGEAYQVFLTSDDTFQKAVNIMKDNKIFKKFKVND